MNILRNGLLPDELKSVERRQEEQKTSCWAKVLKICVAMGWIDYREAYDIVPHSWIVEILSMVELALRLRRCCVEI